MFQKEGLRRRCSALVGATLLATGAYAQCDDVTSQSARVELNLGGIAAPIVRVSDYETFGWAPSGDTLGDFRAISPIGTGAAFRANGSLVLSLIDHYDRLVGFTPIDTDGQPLVEVARPLDGGVHVHANGNAGRLDAWGAVEAHGLYGDAVVTHEMTGRAWRLRMTGESDDLSRLAWATAGIESTTRDERSGDLLLTLDGVHGRTLTLHPAQLETDGEVAYLPFIADEEGIIRLSGPVPAGAKLEAVMVVAPYFHDGDAVADGRGGFVAIGPALDAVPLGDAGSGRDIAVLRTAADGRTFRDLTIIASVGDDESAAIASHQGAALVAARVDNEPVVIRVEHDGTMSVAQSVADTGLAGVRDLAVDAEGRILVAGNASETAKTSGTLDLTSVLPIDDTTVTTDLALIALDRTLTATGDSQVFTGPVANWPLTVSVDCEGRHTVGLQLQSASATALQCTGLFPTWRPVAYEANAPAADTSWVDGYTIYGTGFPYSRFGFHALLWKYYNHNFPPPYDAAAAAAATAPPVPLGQVAFLDSNRLNALEANPAIFPQGDPAGGWQSNTATSTHRGLEAALGAAAYASFWRSPTYANLRLDSGSPSTDGVGIMEVTFCNNAGLWQGPLAICQNALPSGLPIDVFDADCVAQGGPITNNAQIFLDEVRLHEWYTQGGLINQDLMPGHEFKTRFEQASPGGIYIGDPPDATRFAEGHVREAVAREMAAVVEGVPVKVTSYAGGKASNATSGLGLVRTVDRPLSD